MNSELRKEGIKYLKDIDLFYCSEDALKMVFKLYRKMNNIKTRKNITFSKGDFGNEFVINEDIYNSHIYSGSENILVFNLVHTEKTIDRESTISTVLSDDEVCEFDPSFSR